MLRIRTIIKCCTSAAATPLLRQHVRRFHDEFTTPEPRIPAKKPPQESQKPIPTAVANKYQVFRDADATVILDVDEERQRLQDSILAAEIADAENADTEAEDGTDSIYAGLNMERKCD